MFSWLIRKYYNKKTQEKRKEVDESQDRIMELSTLLESYQQRLTSIIESQQEMVCRYNSDTTITFVNNAYCRMFNVQESDLLNTEFINHVFEEDVELVKNVIENLTTDNPTSIVQHRSLINNEIRWQEWSNTAVFNEDDQIIEYQAVGRDITIQKGLEKKLKRQNKLLNSILESSSTLVVRLDTNSNIQYANQSYIDTFFKKDEDYLNVNPLEHHIHKDYRSLLEDIIKKTLEPPTHRYEIEKQSRTASGELRWYRVEVVGIKGTNGDSEKIVQIQSFLQDITEKKQAELKIKCALDEYDTLLNNVDTMVWYVTDPETMGAVNQSYVNFFGVDKKEMIGKKLKDIMDSDNLDTCLFNNRRIFNEGITIRSEEYTFNSNGEKRWLSITKTPKKDSEGNVKYIVVSATDVTDRRIAEDQIKEKELFLKLWLQSIPVPMFYKDINGCYQMFNQAFADLFKKHPDELIGKTVFDINPKEYADIYHNNDKELLKHQSTQIFQTQFKNDIDNKILDIIVHKASVVNISGEITGTVGVIIDITERKKFEDELKKSKQELKNTLDATTDGIWYLNFEKDELIFSDRYYEMLGYKPGEFEASLDNWKKLIHPDDLETALKNV